MAPGDEPTVGIVEPTIESIRSGSPFTGRCEYTSTAQPSGVTTPLSSIQTTLTDAAYMLEEPNRSRKVGRTRGSVAGPGVSPDTGAGSVSVR